MPRAGSIKPKTPSARRPASAPKLKNHNTTIPNLEKIKKSVAEVLDRTRAAGRGASDRSTPSSRQAVLDMMAGRRGSDRSTPASRQAVLDMMTGKRRS